MNDINVTGRSIWYLSKYLDLVVLWTSIYTNDIELGTSVKVFEMDKKYGFISKDYKYDCLR